MVWPAHPASFLTHLYSVPKTGGYITLSNIVTQSTGAHWKQEMKNKHMYNLLNDNFNTDLFVKVFSTKCSKEHYMTDKIQSIIT